MSRARAETLKQEQSVGHFLRAHRVALGAVSLFALALANRLVWLVPFPLDGLYGQDAYAYFGYARTLLDSVTRFAILPPFWWPLGYPALLAAAFAVAGSSIAIAQGITLLCGALVAPLAYALTREAAPSRLQDAAGWTAGLLCALSGQLTQSSLVVMADAPALMWAALGAWLLLRFRRTRGAGALAAASFAVGMAVWTRWQNLLFAAVWFAALLVIEFVERDPRPSSVRQRVGYIFLALVICSVVLAPQLWIRASTGAPLAGQSWLEGWSPANFLARAFDTPDGHFEYALPVALFYGQALAHPAYLFAAFLPLFLLGVWFLVRARRENPTAAVLLLGWIGVMLLFLAGIPYENFRFALGLFVPLAAVTGVGAGWAWSRASARWQRVLLAAWVAIGLAVMLYWQPRVLAPIYVIQTREREQTAWLAAQLPPGSTVWTLGLTGAVNTRTALSARDLWQVSRADILATAPAFVFIDAPNLETQWQGLAPQRLYAELRRDPGLTERGKVMGWTLYQINR